MDADHTWHRWTPQVRMYVADFNGGHFEKCPKMWGGPNVSGPLNKMIPLMEDPGGGGVNGDRSGPMD